MGFLEGPHDRQAPGSSEAAIRPAGTHGPVNSRPRAHERPSLIGTGAGLGFGLFLIVAIFYQSLCSVGAQFAALVGHAERATLKAKVEVQQTREQHSSDMQRVLRKVVPYKPLLMMPD